MNPPTPDSASGPPASLGRNRLLLGFMATRPAFLSVTAVGVTLGWASAAHDHVPVALGRAAITMLLALAAHAGANVINDFHDIDTDTCNTERLYPFTGGSRFIQDGLMSRAATGRLGYGLLAGVILGGLWLISVVGIGLLAIGVLGMLIAWAYSAPPLRLAARGLGEFAVAGGWMLLVLGSDFVQRGSVAPAPAVAGLAFGLMVANLLFINQFPDAEADRAAGKMTVVARVGRAAAVVGYPLLAAGAALALVFGVIAGLFGLWSLLACVALVPAAYAWGQLRQHARQTQYLRSGIASTIIAALVFGLLLAAALALG